VIGRTGHLKDDHLLDCYVAEHTGTAPDAWAADHLSECLDCEARYAELAGFMNGLRADADADVDAAFPPERLATQQQQILHRLEHAHRSARVLSFPAREVSAPSRSALMPAPRWLVAAAAAGLFIGVAVGGYLGPNRLGPAASTARTAAAVRPMTVQPQAAAPTAVRVSTTQAAAVDDEAFLTQLELALDRPQTRELAAFDALTPHVRDLR